MNRNIKEIALAIAIVFGLFSASAYMASAQPQTDQPVPSGLPFGGFIVSYVPASPTCPTSHTLLYDFVKLQLIAVAVVPSSRVYLNNNLVTTGVALLGTHLPTAIPCPLFYPIFPISQVGTS